MAKETLCERLQQATLACLEQARPLLPEHALALPDVGIRCDLRGHSAGQMRHHPDGWLEIRYNLDMATLQTGAFLRETVPHEVAHLVTWLLHGDRVRPHGPEWQSVMRHFGIDAPRRCHDFRPAGAVRRQRTWRYRCDCREHALSTTRHKRALKGTRYHCAACGTALRPVRDEA